MELIVGTVLVVLVLYAVLVGNKKEKPGRRAVAGQSYRKPATLSEAEAAVAIFNEHKVWLSSRWAEANRELEAGDLKSFPSWFFDEVTERQTSLLTSKGISLTGGQLSKGQASDLIGLFFPIDEDDKEVLKFFKVPTKGLNQTTARAEVGKLQADPETATAWSRRPAEPKQKEFYRFFGLKVPGGLTHADAEDFMGKHQQTLASQQHDEWDSYKAILDELSDKDVLRVVLQRFVQQVQFTIVFSFGLDLCDDIGDLGVAVFAAPPTE